jgi:hypothetical protein
MQRIWIAGAKPEIQDELRIILAVESRWRLSWVRDVAQLSGASSSLTSDSLTPDAILLIAPADGRSDALQTLVDRARKLAGAIIVVCPEAIDDDCLRSLPGSIEFLVAPLRAAEVRSRIA